jgi:rubrerythrin
MAVGDLIVLTCKRCGDTFTTHEGDPAVCPSCGGTELELAHEPLL